MAIAAYGFGLDPSASGLGAFISVVSLRGGGGGVGKHADLSDLGPPADDHEQYLLLAGRGGQTIVDDIAFNGDILFGAVTDEIAGIENQNLLDVSGITGGETIIAGTGASDELGLQGSTDVTLGLIRAFSKIMLEPVQSQAVPVDNAGASIVFGETYTTTFPVTQVLLLNDSTWNANAGSSVAGRLLEDKSTVNVNENAGILALFTVVNSSASYVVTDNANHIPNLFALRWAPLIKAQTSGTPPPTALVSALNVTPGIVCSGLLSSYQITDLVGVNFQPTWSVPEFSDADFGDCVALDFRGPQRGFLASNAGTKSLNDAAGIRMRAPAAGLVVDSSWTAVLSESPPDAKHFVIRNTGGAKSTFGLGDLFFGTLDAEEFELTWDPATDVLALQTTGADLTVGLQLNATKISLGTVVPNPTDPVGFLTVKAPDQVATVPGDFIFYDFRVSEVDDGGFALDNATLFDVGVPIYINNGGSLTTLTNFTLGGVGFGSSTFKAQSLWARVGARIRNSGIENWDSAAPAQITADQVAYDLGAVLVKRPILEVSTDASRTIQGIRFEDTTEQDHDFITFYNVGSFDLVFGHEDVAAVANFRITSPTGADYVLGPEEWVTLWRDGPLATGRWRIKDRPPRSAEIIGPILDTELEDALANTIQLRNAGTTGPRADVKISGLTEETAPVAGDWVLGEESGGALRKIDAKHLIKPTLTMERAWDNPTSSDDKTFQRTPVAITVTAVHGVLNNGTGSPDVTVSILHSTDRNAAGNQAVNAQVVSSITTGDSLTLGGDLDIPANSWIWAETTGQNGTTPEIALTITYTED